MPSVFADFGAHLTAETADWNDPIEGRVLLGENQLVLAANQDDTVTIPLESIFDIRSGTTPQPVASLPGRPVTVAFQDGDRRVVAVVAADERTTEKFTIVLFKTILNGTAVTAKHPARLGGRILDTDFQGGLLSISSTAVQIEVKDGSVAIPLSSLIDFARGSRSVDGVDRPVIMATHLDTDDALLTLIAMDESRDLSLLGRYLRREFQKVVESIETLDLSEGETETLATVYSTRDMNVSLPEILGADPTRVKRLLHGLHEKGLIEAGDNGPVLTRKGHIVVTQQLERVNA
jgi:helix-turn-helix protein